MGDGVKNSVGHIGSAGEVQNGDRFYTVGALRKAPKDLEELTAIVNYSFIMLTSIVSTTAVYIGFMIFLPHEWSVFASPIFAAFVALPAMEVAHRVLLRSKKHTVSYSDGRIKHDGNVDMFGKDIWDIEMRGWPTKRTLLIYTIRKKPYMMKLKFLHHAEAKYIHDLFHSGRSAGNHGIAQE